MQNEAKKHRPIAKLSRTQSILRYWQFGLCTMLQALEMERLQHLRAPSSTKH
jgi:hypothetical protein